MQQEQVDVQTSNDTVTDLDDLELSSSSSSVSDVDETDEVEIDTNKEKIEWLSTEFCNVGHRILTMQEVELKEDSTKTDVVMFQNFVSELTSMSFKMGDRVQPISWIHADDDLPAVVFWDNAAKGAYKERWNFHNYWLDKMNMTDKQRCRWFETIDHVQRAHYPIVQRIHIFKRFLDYVEHVILDNVCRDAMHWLDMDEYPDREIDANGNLYE